VAVVATATGSMLQMHKDSNAEPSSIATEQGNMPIYKSLMKDPTVISKKRLENRSSTPVIQPAGSSPVPLTAIGATKWL
jgi:hypothetical protein